MHQLCRQESHRTMVGSGGAEHQSQVFLVAREVSPAENKTTPLAETCVPLRSERIFARKSGNQ